MKTLQILFISLLSVAAAAQQPLTLSQAIDSARANRPAYEAARLRVSQANLSRRAAAAFPTTRLFVGHSSEPEAGGTDDDLVLAQPIDIFGRTSAGRRAGDALVAQAEASFRQVMVEIQNEVVTAYVEAAAAKELAKTAHSLQETLERLHEATRLRVLEGVVPGVQLTRVGLELDQAKLRTQQRQAQLRASLRRLSALIGSSEAPTDLAGIPTFPIEQLDVATLLRQRPDLVLLAADVQAAEADARTVRLSGLPELEIQGRRTPWQQSDHRYGVRVQLSIPLLDYGRVRAETRAATTRTEAARKSLADAQRLAEGEIAAVRIEVESAGQQVTQYETLVATARQLVERLRPALTEQATTLLEVIDATRTLREVEEGLVEARERLAQAQARYLRATGQILEVPSR